MVTESLPSKPPSNCKTLWKKLNRHDWTPQMRDSFDKMTNKYSRSNMMMFGLILMGTRLLALAGYIIGGTEISPNILPTFIVFIPIIIILKKHKFVRELRFLFPVAVRLGMSAFIVDLMTEYTLGFITGVMYISLLVESYTIVKNLWLEVFYMLLQFFVLSFAVFQFDYERIVIIRMVGILLFMTFGGIFCSLSRTMVETDMVEARFKSNDLDELIKLLPVGIVVASRSGAVFLKNDTFRSYSKILCQYDPRDSERDSNVIVNYLKSPSERRKSDIVHRGDSSFEISQHSVSCFDELAQVLLIQDVSETQRAIRELKKLDQFKTNLIRTVSHDYRTPLNVIVNGLDLVLDSDDLPIGMIETVDLCKQASRFLLYLVNDLLDYYQLKTDSFKMNFLEFDLVSVVNSTLQLLNMKAAAKKITLTTNLASQVPHSMKSDPDRLRQILINLVTNAIKYSNTKGKVHVVVKESVKIRKGVRIEVRDEGLGIRKEDRHILFTEFGRIIDTENLAVNPKGVGLGLWICRQFSLQLGSAIELESEYGHGSTFSFDLRDQGASEDLSDKNLGDSFSEFDSACWMTSPATEGDHSLQREDREISTKIESESQRSLRWLPSRRSRYIDSDDDLVKEESTLLTKKRGKVLVIDDEVFNQIVLENILNRLNFDYEAVSSGVEALEKFLPQSDRAEPEYDLLIVDYDMPMMNGPELIQQIRDTELIPKEVIIFGHTAFGETERNELISSGANDILDKPVNQLQLRNILEKHHLLTL